MKESHKKKVRKSVLKSKAELEKNLSKQLKQYGIFPDRLVDVEELDLTREKKQRRRDLEEVLEKIKHKDTGDKTEQEYYVRKAAYTYFNRLAALKLMESHSLLDNVITPNSEFGNQPELLFHYKDITDIQNEDRLYESYFTGIFDDLDQEIGKIFDMDNQTSILFPSSNSIDTVIEELDEIPEEAWRQEEIIGWMYQYFISEEKDEAFDKLNNDDQKINGSTLPAVTSLYTPHWIVEYLVDNTLGVMWKEMHPDTDIDEICDYIVPDQEFEERETKDIEEITLLDPACGSGHFLLYAFDVFYKMYKEEGYDEKEIPQKILENNLYGIDVDNRSSQLSALALYVKAKELTPEAEISQLNIISADAVLMNGEKKEKLLEKTRHDIEEEIIEEIWDNFQHLDERGSLVKVEEPVREKITEYKNNLNKEDKDQQLIHQFSDETRELKSSSGQQKLAESVSTEEYWDIIEEQMVQRVQELGQEAIQAQDMSEQLFAAETEKTLHLLDYLMGDYDIVATNPPYLTKGNMRESMRDFANNQYPKTRYDLYSMFIERATSFSKSNGKIGMITQQSFMFIKSFTDLRKNLLNNHKLKTLAHTGTDTFQDISGEKVNTCLFTIDSGDSGLKNTPVFLRSINNSNKQGKIERIIENNEDKFKSTTQNEFLEIEKAPLSYWTSQKAREIFVDNKPLSEFANCVVGLSTGDNDKFLRWWWEVPSDSINEKWFPVARGGNDQWYADDKEVILWKDEGKAIKNFTDEEGNVKSRVISEQHYGKSCICHKAVSSDRMNARSLSEGYIFEHASQFILPESLSDNYILALLNSRIGNYLLSVINPTINFLSGDVERIPIVEPKKELSRFIDNKAKEIINYRRTQSSYDINSNNFESPPLLDKDGVIIERFRLHIEEKESIEVKISEKESAIENKLSQIYELDSNDYKIINEQLGPEICSFDKRDLDGHEEQRLEQLYLEGKEVPWGNRTRTKKMEIRDIAEELEVHPAKVFEKRKQMELFRDDDIEKEVKKLLSYFVQVSLGRWEMEGVEPDEDGILMVSEDVGSDDPSLMDKIRECIAAEWGEENVSDIESEINNILYHGMEKWVKKYFFKNFHYKMYNKRPVVWEVKTPNDHFKAFIYYHKLDEDTLPKLQVEYIEPLMTEYNNKKNMARENGNTAEAEKLEDKVEDLRALKDQLEDVIDEGYSPDLDEGVKHNFKSIEEMTSKEMK